MAARVCWRCALHRPSIQPVSITFSPAATFSTSTPLSKLPGAPKRKGPGGLNQGPPARGRKSLNLGKLRGGTKNVSARRRPEPGERKAVRKRVVLSNTNAFEVPDLPEWTPENCCGDSAKELEGSIVTLNGDTVDALRALDSFKPTQSWEFFRRPTTLVRGCTAELSEAINAINTGASKEVYRRIIAGERGSGKSLLLLQAHALALLNGWVVIHIPDAQELVIASTAYAPLPTSSPDEAPLYAQRDYTAALLERIATANAAVLSKMSLAHKHQSFPIPLQENISLDRLAQLGARDPEIAWDVFMALWKELTVPAGDAKRPQVLLTLDGLAHVSRFSAYLSASMHHIHAHDLALISHFISCLTGSTSLGPQGGMVLAADSMSNRPSVPSLDLALKQSAAHTKASSIDAQLSDTERALAQLTLHDPLNPYAQFDTRSLAAAQRVKVTRLAGLDKTEARTMLEYYARSGMFRQSITEALVLERWLLAGNGVFGELERGTVRTGVM